MLTVLLRILVSQNISILHWILKIIKLKSFLCHIHIFRVIMTFRQNIKH